MNLGGPFPPKLGIIRFHSGQCPTKKNWLVFGLVPCMFFTDMLQFLWWLGSLPSSPKASCSEIFSWNDKLMIWFHVCVHISTKKSVSQRVPSILSHHQLAVANAKAALERPGAISSRPLAWRPTVMRNLEELTFFGFNILKFVFLNYCIAWFQLNLCHPKKCRDYEAPACFVIWGDCRKKIISLGPVLRRLIIEIRIPKDWRKSRWCSYILCFKNWSSRRARKSGQW